MCQSVITIAKAMVAMKGDILVCSLGNNQPRQPISSARPHLNNPIIKVKPKAAMLEVRVALLVYRNSP
jgi:hypothetical protein